MDYFKQLDVAGSRLAQTVKCTFCRRAIPGIVEQLKATRERTGADCSSLDATKDVSDKLDSCHRLHPKGRFAGLQTKRRPGTRFGKSSGRRSAKLR